MWCVDRCTEKDVIIPHYQCAAVVNDKSALFANKNFARTCFHVGARRIELPTTMPGLACLDDRNLAPSMAKKKTFNPSSMKISLKIETSYTWEEAIVNSSTALAPYTYSPMSLVLLSVAAHILSPTLSARVLSETVSSSPSLITYTKKKNGLSVSVYDDDVIFHCSSDLPSALDI